ncbi:hypothetical protein [Bradyrhizobium sp.]|uniref:hypothetical protein n=1 Tax=Bradyrhizobium sp. TaxID=376 RepID=UPI00262EC2E9|nr:hypothetical protein [Bradyrhizobium sp.]
MSHYYAIISTGSPDEVYKRATVEADTIKEAEEMFIAQFGREQVIKVWDDYQESKSRWFSG